MNRLSIVIFIALLWVVGSIPSYSQPLCTFRQYTIADGYVHGSVSEMLQDSRGLIWISTRDGLTQFDGYNFKNIKSYPGEGIFMGTSNIGLIVENSQGNIWCKNQDGKIYLFDVATRTFHDILKHTESDTFKNDAVIQIYTLKKGVSWIICKNDIAYRVPDSTCIQGMEISRHALKGSKITRIYQDSEGDEWIVSEDGISIIGRKKFTDSTRYIHLNGTENAMWLADARTKIAKFDFKTQTTEEIDTPPELKSIITTKRLRDNTLVIGTSNLGLLFYDSEGLMFSQVDVCNEKEPKNEVYTIYEDGHGDLWMMNRYPGILHYNRKTGIVKRLQSPTEPKLNYEQPNKTLITEDKQGNVWVVPKDGFLCYFDRRSQQLKYYYTEPGNPASILSPPVRFFFTDGQGNLWLDNIQSLCKISFFPKDFTLIEKEANELEIRSLMLDRNKNLWVGAKNGVVRIMDPNNKCIGYLTKNGTLSQKPALFDANVYTMLEDRQGNIWMGTRLKGLFILKPNAAGTPYSYTVHHFENSPSDKFSLNNNNVFSIHQDRQGRIWIGTYGGGVNLVQYDALGNIQFLNRNNLFSNYPSNTSSGVRSINELENGIILLGTTDGLISFSSNFSDPQKIQFFRNTRRANDKKSLINNDVFCVFTDRNKNTFVLSRNGGISQIVSENILSDSILFRSFTERDGLLSDQTQAMIEDSKGVLWLISTQSLSKFFPEQWKVEHFSSFLQSQNINFTEAAPILNAKDKVIIGADKGILEVEEQKYLAQIVPPIILTELAIQGEKTNPPLKTNPGIILNPSQRNVLLQFAALDYRDSKNILYAYKMEGIDKDWNYSGRDRSATYVNMPHGSYQFLVRSTNSEGAWVDNTYTVNIKVKPKFIETVWAWILFAIVAIALMQVIVFVLFRIYRLRHEVMLEQKLSDLKLNFFTNISHELRTPLTLIISPVSDILSTETLSKKAKEHLTIVQKNTDRMLRMVNQILDIRRIQYNKLKLYVQETEVVAFVAGIMDSFKLTAEEKRIDFALVAEPDKVVLWIDRDKFEKIIFNLLSNAFKYTPDERSVKVRITDEGTKVSISVIDTGTGIQSNKLNYIFQRFETLANKETSEVSSGIGLSLVKELAEMHQATIHVKSQPFEGSEFRVTFKKGEQHFVGNSQVEMLLSESAYSSQYGTTVENTAFPLQKYDDQEPEKWSVLIVEDNTELRQFLKNVLDEEYTIFEASNGLEGLNLAHQLVPDLIITDVMMPMKDGLEMVREIKENFELCHIPIIMLSSKSSVEDRIAGLEQGIDEYIAKPFSTSYLIARIQNLMKHRQVLQDFYLKNIIDQQSIAFHKQLNPAQPKISNIDESFIEKMLRFLEENIDKAELSVEDFSASLGVSRAVFFKKTKMLLGTSPVDFIREFRIKRAVQLIDGGIHSMADVAFKCGFNDPNYFSKCFKKQVGVTPSEYKKNNSQTH